MPQNLLADLARSPLLIAGAVFSGLFGVAFAVWPAQAVNDALDAFAIAGAGLTCWRFAAEACRGLRQRDPDGASLLIVALFGIVASIGLLRLLREFGLQLGVIGSDSVGVVFGVITAMMVFSIFLLVVAPPVRRLRFHLSPWSAFALALLSGSMLTALVFVVRKSW